MNPVLVEGRAALFQGNALNVREFGADSVDAVLTDPPYELGFMGKKWDASGIAFSVELWRGVLEVLKPGAHLLAFGGTRTYHRMTCAIEDAGFEIRDSLHWFYGTGFPKSLDVSKAIDSRRDWKALETLQAAVKEARTRLGLSQSEAARRMGLIGPEEQLGGGGYMWFETGFRTPTREQWPRLKFALGLGDSFDAAFEAAEREVVGTHRDTSPGNNMRVGLGGEQADTVGEITTALSAAGRRWAGWGTALKPGHEPIVLARKPLEGTVAASVLEHGTGALNVGACSLSEERWPANVLLDDEAASELGEKARFFYVAKPGRAERDLGCAALEPKTGGAATDRSEHSDGLNSPRAGAGRTGGARNFHPTVKPVELLRYLARLITPPGGLILDPFAGSGSTGVAALSEGFEFLGVDLNAEYLPIAKARLEHALKSNPNPKAA